MSLLCDPAAEMLQASGLAFSKAPSPDSCGSPSPMPHAQQGLLLSSQDPTDSPGDWLKADCHSPLCIYGEEESGDMVSVSRAVS